MLGSPLDLTLPEADDTMADVVAKTAAALANIEDVLEQRVTPASLNINAALPCGGNQITGVGALTLVPAAVPVASGSVYYSDGEFFLVSPAGTVQVTFEGDLNVGATGTIVGDYGGGNPARVTYDDAAGEYRFTEETNVYADLVADDVVLKSAAGSVRLGVTNDITTARSVLFKEIAGSGVSLFVYDSASSTVEMAETKRVTNNVLLTTLDASGNISAADHKFTALKYKKLQVATGRVVLGTGSYSSAATPVFTVATVDAGISLCELDYYPELDSGEKLREVKLKLNKTSGGNIEVTIYKVDYSGAFTLVEADTYSTAGVGDLTITVADHTALASYEDYLIAITFPAVGDQLRAIGVARTRT